MSKYKVLAAAIALQEGIILTLPPPRRHPDIFLLAESQGLSLENHEQGFLVGNWKRHEFATRKEAWSVAYKAGQIRKAHSPGVLYTEDMW